MIDQTGSGLSRIASAAYGRIGSLSGDTGVADGAPASAGDFGATLHNALQGAVETGHQADQQTVAALNGEASLTDVVTAVSRAQLALQTTTAIRDRVVQAYQDIMRMSI